MTLKQWFYRNIYLHTRHWKKIRRLVMKRANYVCEEVNCKRHGYRLDVHHTTYKIVWLERFFLKKMVYLCRKHHTQTHGGVYLQLKSGRTLPPFGYKR